MAQWASDHLGHPVAFELSIENVDKPPLDFAEIKQRGERFEPSWSPESLAEIAAVMEAGISLLRDKLQSG